MHSVIINGLKKIITLFIIIIIAISSTYLYFIINYPLSYQMTIKKYSEQFNVDPYIVAAIINVESKYDRDAISNKDARGLMQIAPITGQWASEELKIQDFNVEDLFKPELNIMIGTWYLNMLNKEFDNNLQLVLAAYNAGSGNVAKWLQNKKSSDDGVSLKDIPYPETREYVKKVENNIRIYKTLYEGEFGEHIAYDENYLVIFINNLRKLVKKLVIYK